MHTITQIGVIDTAKQLHVKFANKALNHLLNTESALSFALWTEGQGELVEITSKRARAIITDILHINKVS